MKIEKLILSRPGDWVFDGYVSKIFDRHIRKSIPYYDEVQNLIGSISKEVLSDNALVYDLGTATGEVINTIHKVNSSLKLEYVGIDISEQMLEKAKEKCAGIEKVTFYNECIEDFNYKPSDLFISAFTLQFIEPEKRIQVLKKVKKALKKDGYFILCEKVVFEDEKMSTIFIKIHENWKTRYFSKSEITAKKKSLKNVMRTLPLSEYMNLLKATGFQSIQSFFQWGNFVCLLVR